MCNRATGQQGNKGNMGNMDNRATRATEKQRSKGTMAWAINRRNKSNWAAEHTRQQGKSFIATLNTKHLLFPKWVRINLKAKLT